MTNGSHSVWMDDYCSEDSKKRNSHKRYNLEEEVREVLGNASWDRQGRVGAGNGSGWMAVGWLGLVAEEFTFAFFVEIMSRD